jgi:predicted 3-demethylubiquinone-9 3-methyltransferase (glyoxalase superfamily)
MQTLGTCLWFDTQAEEAAAFYVSLFKDGRLGGITYYQEGGPRPAGTVLTVRFLLDGREFVALNGGPQYAFTPAMSLVVHCDTQEEVDETWGQLCEGGEAWPCGWVKDRFGVSWQVVPKGFMEMLASPDRAAVQRAFSAMMGMKKLDLPALRRAFEGA